MDAIYNTQHRKQVVCSKKCFECEYVHIAEKNNLKFNYTYFVLLEFYNKQN